MTPALVKPSNGSYRVDPDWHVDKIEYVYEWWGLGDPILDYQVVRREGDGYLLGSLNIDTRVITSLIESLRDLHPTQFSLIALSHTDDYPSWRMEFVGSDGRRLLVYSSSTGNPGSAPWNVLDNGRLYAQYTGAIAEPMSDLFHSPQGEPAAAFFPGGWDPDYVFFATAGWPPQLTEGFEGLLPVSDSFQYTADATSGTIRAFLQGRSSIGGFGNMILGEITALNQALLSIPNETTVPCTVEEIKAEDPSAASWAIECQAGPATSGSHFKFPLRLEISTSDGRDLHIDGALIGVWNTQKGTMLLPPPSEIVAPLTAYGPATLFLQDHPVVFYNYVASISREGIIAASGEAILLGDVQIGDRKVPYTLATPFGVEGKTVEWVLSEEELDLLILDVMQTPLVTRALPSLPNLMINLYYSESMNLPEFPMLLNSSPVRYSISLAQCASVPASQYPDLQHPLRAFSLNGRWAFERPQFVLIDGKPIIVDLDLWPYRDDPPSITSLLIPPQLDTGSAPPFERIWFNSDSFIGGGPELTLWVPRGIDPTTTEPYSRIFSSLPAPIEHWAGNIWVARGLTLLVAPDGSLQISVCAGE